MTDRKKVNNSANSKKSIKDTLKEYSNSLETRKINSKAERCGSTSSKKGNRP